MTDYAKSHFHLRAEQEREKAMASPHQWQREQYLAMAALFERLSQSCAIHHAALRSACDAARHAVRDGSAPL